MNFYRYILYIVLILLFAPSECHSATELTQDSKEYSFLKKLFEDGNNNSSILLRLSNLSPNTAEALCYARLGLETAPNSLELKNRVDSLRVNAKINEDIPGGIKTSPPSTSFLILMNFISKSQLSLVFSLVSGITILMFFTGLIFKFPNSIKRLHIFFYLLSAILFVELFLITRTINGRYKLVSSFKDFNKIQGVVLSERNVYSAPSDSAQQMNLLKPSWEINIYKGEADSPWVLVDSNDKRQGWMNGLEDICLIEN